MEHKTKRNFLKGKKQQNTKDTIVNACKTKCILLICE